jgi:two-component system, sensor histidine kinase and response regulator
MISTEEMSLVHDQKVPPGKSPGQPGCVLLAEDDPALRRYLEIVLNRAGYRVLPASDGLEAMKLVLINSIDIVVTDAVMPTLSGYELCRFIRSSQRLSHLPIILLSAIDPKNAEADLVDMFLSKPVSPEDLVECISRLLAQRVMIPRPQTEKGST